MDKNRKATINLVNKKENKCFQYAATVALNYKKIKRDPQRITKIKAFINKYNWQRINYPPTKDDWKKFEKKILPLFLISFLLKKKKIYAAFVSKYNSS